MRTGELITVKADRNQKIRIVTAELLCIYGSASRNNKVKLKDAACTMLRFYLDEEEFNEYTAIAIKSYSL